eukprot:gnl/TRDRNA2_/TRDRNA2_135219_c0_seq1.p1 gnl/TRDRNA2_/TRDRNA2_135219_c0~~gnl/TRDRNA2_/TRDRNA2_135219_c0_seq1.p1  ORF type:complete len:609 (-),score=82.87 gnl/TRDRNA2_/TRDRNA2_135219_c0_seq1:43-1770(-)
MGKSHAAHRGLNGLILAALISGSEAIASSDCWVGGWTPEICCSAPGAKGNPLCWDHVYTFDKCCTETEEGIQFDLRRRSFVSDMVRRGATVHFDIRHVSGGRTGAVASRTLSSRATVLRVPATQVFSIKSVSPQIGEAAKRQACDPHAALALGLAHERVSPVSVLADWINLLPMTFSNVLWFTDRQLELVNSTFFNYILANWFSDLECMQRAARDVPPGAWRARRVDYEDLRWALSVVKTRGFAFEGTRESTMLIPLADFLNHNQVANVRTAAIAEDALRFVATRAIMPGEELCIEYAQASNLEFLVRYGFRVDDNPYGGRQFDLGGEPMQAHCPSYILRYDTPEVIENATVDCHRQARYLSFEQQFGSLAVHEQLREDRYIYRAVEEACAQMLQMLDTPTPLSEYEIRGADSITSVLVREIRNERVLLQRCVHEFQKRQQELGPRPVPPNLAEPLARLRAGGYPSGDGDVGFEDAGPTVDLDGDRGASAGAGAFGAEPSPGGAFGAGQPPPAARSPFAGASTGAAAPDRSGGMASGRPAPSSLADSTAGVFAASVDRTRVDQLLQRLQQGGSLV